MFERTIIIDYKHIWYFNDISSDLFTINFIDVRHMKINFTIDCIFYCVYNTSNDTNKKINQSFLFLIFPILVNNIFYFSHETILFVYSKSFTKRIFNITSFTATPYFYYILFLRFLLIYYNNDLVQTVYRSNFYRQIFYAKKHLLMFYR